MMEIAEPDGTSPAVLKKGTLFERRYKVLSPLGEGCRKRTYLAEDTHLGRKVVLAVIKDAASARTIPEWQALAQIAGHYNIVTLFDRGTADGVEYLVFEYLSSGTLSDYLAKRKDPLTVDEALRLGRQVARALSHMHGKGMIHRDVAAANIWLDERHSAHLGDFDLAVLREAQDDSDSGTVSTEGYAAPERAAGRPVDERSDLYSLGAVLYEAVTGRRPPREGPPRNAEIAGCLAARRPVLPHRLTDVIGRLLAESPQDRPESAQEVLDALKVPGSAGFGRRLDRHAAVSACLCPVAIPRRT